MDNSRSNRSKILIFRYYLLPVCLLLSVLVHLVFILVLHRERPTEVEQPPTLIQLVDRPLPDLQPEQQPSYEIDQHPLPPDPELEVESPRRADQDQLVEREQAPEGEDTRDQTRLRAIPPQPPAQEPAAPSPPPVTSSPPSPPPTPARAIRAPELPAADAPEPPMIPESAVTPPESTERESTRLTREQLFPDPSTFTHIAEAEQAERDKRRERDDVEIGDEIWLNLQHDRLVSFFRRFHDRVERVWNYPSEAVLNGIEGTLELLIIVTREGELVDVDLRRTSGSDLLDFEAIQAVYRAAPFGPLGRHYPHDQLRIRAHFQYQISGRYIYGR